MNKDFFEFSRPCLYKVVGHLSRRAFVQKGICPEGHLSKRAFVQKGISPKGHFSKWSAKRAKVSAIKVKRGGGCKERAKKEEITFLNFFFPTATLPPYIKLVGGGGGLGLNGTAIKKKKKMGFPKLPSDNT